MILCDSLSVFLSLVCVWNNQQVYLVLLHRLQLPDRKEINLDTVKLAY